MNALEHQIGEMKVTLGNVLFTLFFDYTFVSILQQPIDGKPFQDIVKDNPLRLIPLITLCGIKAGDDVNPSEIPTERQISRLLMGAGPEVSKQILDNYNTSMGFIGAVYNNAVETVESVAAAGTK